MTCLTKVAKAKEQSGIFILATSNMSDDLDMARLLAAYKSQQTVERGFRLLKSPDFMASSLFLKKPDRIEALLMFMTCSLMVYSALEHRSRQSLRQKELTFPDMKNKPSQKPTARWVFQCFGGIHELGSGDPPPLQGGIVVQFTQAFGLATIEIQFSGILQTQYCVVLCRARQGAVPMGLEQVFPANILLK